MNSSSSIELIFVFAIIKVITIIGVAIKVIVNTYIMKMLYALIRIVSGIYKINKQKLDPLILIYLALYLCIEPYY